LNISAVIPCYNGEDFLTEAVSSINQQTYLPKEIIIVNDGSTDQSKEIIKQLELNSRVPIKCFEQNNSGVSAARNVGIANARFEWIAFLDVDDQWLPNMLEEKVKYAKANNMSSGLICCNYYEDLIDSSCEKYENSKYAHQACEKLLFGTDFQLLFLKENFVGTASAMMFSRDSALQIGGFDSFLKHSEDFDFILRIACITSVAILSKPLALKRHHGNNLTDDKELYYYSHYFSCKKNLSYISEYSKVSFSASVKHLMQMDLEKFATGFCNQIYERKKLKGLILYVRFFSEMKTYYGLKFHFIGFARKMIRTLSFGLIKRS